MSPASATAATLGGAGATIAAPTIPDSGGLIGDELIGSGTIGNPAADVVLGPFAPQATTVGLGAGTAAGSGPGQAAADLGLPLFDLGVGGYGTGTYGSGTYGDPSTEAGAFRPTATLTEAA